MIAWIANGAQIAVTVFSAIAVFAAFVFGLLAIIGLITGFAGGDDDDEEDRN